MKLTTRKLMISVRSSGLAVSRSHEFESYNVHTRMTRVLRINDSDPGVESNTVIGREMKRGCHGIRGRERGEDDRKSAAEISRARPRRGPRVTELEIHRVPTRSLFLSLSSSPSPSLAR